MASVRPQEWKGDHSPAVAEAGTVLRDEKLATLPGIHRLSSTIVMKRVVTERPFPL
jgi:hypothetical protein